MGGLGRCLALVGMLAVSACLQADVTTCEDGSVCPAGTRCDVAHQRCLEDAQITACEGLDDGESCELVGIPQAVCVFGACEAAGCGDGVLVLPEQCEPGLEVAETCSTLGFYVTSGAVGCLSDCTFDTGNCAETCGDGVRNGPEECEDDDVAERDCTHFGFYQPGGLDCTTYCRFDVSACTETCGDHVVQNGHEICEDAPPVGQSCLDYGFDSGLLGCTGSCTPAFDDCVYLGWRVRPVGVPTLSDVWGAAPDDIWAVGPDGAIVHFDGDEWSDLTATVGETADLYAIWGSSASDIWAVGELGRVIHYDGSAWTGTNPGTATLRGLWGTAADDVWAVGHGGAILRWNGTAWSTQSSPTATTLLAVWGIAADDVWVVGDSIGLRWNGAAWQTVVSGFPNLQDVWGNGPDSVYLVGQSTPSYHWDGAGLRQLPFGSLGGSAAGGSRATHNVVSGDAFIFHDDGTELAYAELPVPRAVFGLWGFPDGTIVGVGSQGSALHWEAHVGWTRQTWTGPVGDTLRDVWLASPYFGYAISTLGGIWELIDGGRWVQVTDLPATLLSVSGTAADDVWVTGPDGVYHYTGGIGWVETPIGTAPTLWAIWGSGPTDAFAVGDSGTILHWNGSAWSPMTSNTTRSLLAVWGNGPSDVFAAGNLGTIVHYDGTSWTPMTTGTTEVFRGLGGTATDDVWAVGQTGGVFHWNGTAWTASGPGVDESFYRVLAFAPDDVLIGGSGGRLYHWNGSAWMPILAPVPFEIIGMSGGPQAITMVGGGGNRMLRLIRPEVCAAAETGCGDGTDEDCDGAVDCDDTECAADPACAGGGPCGPGTVIACGANLSGTTTGAGNQITDYGCGQYPDTGPDVGYRFSSPIERDVVVTVSPVGQRVLDLILVGGTASGACGPADHCLDAVYPGTGDAQLAFRAYPNQVYYLVVDGYRGEAGNFSIQVSCP